ncbi:uncharacterized protein SCHCODRAFT_02604920 [Schizophyllum commune H4-8]|uniref:uncharacterized protein n=1 Tax=Schizophyllum commune (strain H4-8 / FGSC 9210) TaxID=578458 RepID=UPI00215F5E52|nr:uncharacterized protein SCHCODRAFT_02604920 [Schizophyllum commune H4-8]KAI5899359.1 hypothetical protein SCHCODRAFT_02604920 [Schizophyllum commune H4-8]
MDFKSEMTDSDGEIAQTPLELQMAMGEALEHQYEAEELHKIDGVHPSPTPGALTLYRMRHPKAKQGARSTDVRIELTRQERLDLCATIFEEGKRYHHDTFSARDVDPLPLGRSPAYISPSTKFRMLEAISSAETHLRLVDSYNFTGLPSHLAIYLAQHRQAVEAYIDRRRHHLAPIRALPVEILLQIFTLARATLGTRNASLINDTSQALPFARVCRHWRDVCLHNGSLWSSIDLHVPDLVKGMTFGNERVDRMHSMARRQDGLFNVIHEDVHLKPGVEDQRGWATIYRAELLLGIHLCYSGSSPLTIRLSGDLPSHGQKAELSDTLKRLSTLMARLAEHSLRWRNVSIDGTLLDCLPIARGPFPALESLRLGRVSWRDHNFSKPFLSANKLRSFAGVTLFPPGIGIPWAQLHDIRLEGGINPILETLAVCDNLKVCTIARVNKRFSGYPLPERTPALDIHTLRFVQARSPEEGNPDALSMMFQVLRLPHLETLEVHTSEIPGKRFRWCPDELADMLGASQCLITRLALTGVSVTLDELCDLSFHMPTLETLSLVEYRHDDKRLIDEDFFARMADVKFPKLRHLELDGRMRVQDDNVIPAMVEARALRARLMPQAFCALESFSIMLRRRYALHRRALVRLHAALRDGFFERWAPPPSLYQRPVMSNHDPVAVASTAQARRVRLIDALEDFSATDDEEDSQEVEIA